MKLNLTYVSFARDVKAPLEKKVFNLIISYTIFLAVLATIVNIAAGLPLSLILTTFMCIVFGVCLKVFSDKAANITPYAYFMFGISMTFILLSWFLNGGLDGPTLSLLIMYSVPLFMVLPFKKLPLSLAVILLVMAVMLSVELFRPDLISRFVSREQRLFDHFLSSALMITGLYFIVSLVQKSYEEEQRIIELQNADLQNYNEQLNEKNELIKAYSNELKDTNKTKDRFIAIIAHDLRAPYTALIGYSELLTNTAELSKNDIESFSSIINSISKNSLNMLETLLEWAATQTSAFKLHIEQLTLAQIVHEITELYTDIAQSKEIRLVESVAGDAAVFADKHSVQTVLRNLVNNAIKFSERNSMVTIYSESSPDFVTLHIKDHGKGMTEEDMNNLFEYDKLLKSEGTEGEQGTGLGLILCKEYVEMNGGNILVQSELGVGSTFSLTLPVTQKDNAAIRKSLAD